MPRSLVSQAGYKYWLVEAYRVTMYHGTQLELLPSVLKSGIKTPASLQKGRTWGDPGNPDKGQYLYLTPEVETAARYGVQWALQDIPAIIELVISSPKKMAKVGYDPYDRAETAWDGMDGRDDDALLQIEETLKHAAGKALKVNFVVQYRLWSQLDGNKLLFAPQAYAGDLETARGYNLYRGFLAFAKKFANATAGAGKGTALFKANNRQWLAAYRKALPPGSPLDGEGYLEVSPSGTVRLTNEYFSSRAQFRYPRNLPPKTFKAIWLPLSTIPPQMLKRVESRTRRTFGARLLPHEWQQILEDLRETIDGLRWRLKELAEKIPAVDEQEEWLRDIDLLYHIWIKDGPLTDNRVEMAYGNALDELKTGLDKISTMAGRLMALDPEERAAELDDLTTKMTDFAEDVVEPWEDEIAQGYGDSKEIGANEWVRLKYPTDRGIITAALEWEKGRQRGR